MSIVYHRFEDLDHFTARDNPSACLRSTETVRESKNRFRDPLSVKTGIIEACCFIEIARCILPP